MNETPSIMKATTLANDAEQLSELLKITQEYALAYLEGLNSRAVGAKLPSKIPQTIFESEGVGAVSTLQQFQAQFDALLSASPGSRYLGFVTGGTTPAALMADWLVSTFDQNAQWSGETVAPYLEQQALNALRDLLQLGEAFSGICVTGATMANFTGLAIGRQWLSEQRGLDIAKQGLHVMSPIKILSGSPHSSVYKAAAMLGLGYDAIEKIACRTNSEVIDTAALAARLQSLQGESVIVVGNAGMVNNADFDPLAEMAALKSQHEFWFHVDGAFGLMAAASPRWQVLTKGAELADSVAVDGHKWLNVPYDAGYLFTRHIGAQVRTFQNISPYLGTPVIDPLNTLHLGPENSRRWRALPLWFTLKAYGSEGVRALIENCCDMAMAFGSAINEIPGLKLVAPVQLNIVCFTLDRPCTMDDMKALQKKLTDSGNMFVTPSSYLNQPILRAAFSNWRVTKEDIEIMRQTLLEAMKST